MRNVRLHFFAPPLVAALALLPGAGASAPRQRPQTGPCPNVTVSCPDTVTESAPMTFTAKVSGGDQNVTPTFNWTVSAGTITSGQGTSSITTDTAGIGGQTATATADVGGYDRNCSTSSSCTVSVMKKVEARKIDEFGQLRVADANVRLDNFAIELQNDPTSQAYVLAYGGRTSRAGFAQASADRVKSYLVKTRGIDAARVVTMDGGYKEPWIELWLVPAGATPPVAHPAVDPKDVKPAPPTRPTRRPPAGGRRP